MSKVVVSFCKPRGPNARDRYVTSRDVTRLVRGHGAFAWEAVPTPANQLVSGGALTPSAVRQGSVACLVIAAAATPRSF